MLLVLENSIGVANRNVPLIVENPWYFYFLYQYTIIRDNQKMS